MQAGIFRKFFIGLVLSFVAASQPLSAASMERTFFFGRYPFDAGGKAEPIEWVVLNSPGLGHNYVSLATRYGIEARSFDSRGRNSWYRSELNRWLNTEFRQKAFTRDEAAEIDGITLMSLNYILTFRPEQRMLEPTPYAKKRGAKVDKKTGTAPWWVIAGVCYGKDCAGGRKPVLTMGGSMGTVVTANGGINDVTPVASIGSHPLVRPVIMVPSYVLEGKNYRRLTGKGLSGKEKMELVIHGYMSDGQEMPSIVNTSPSLELKSISKFSIDHFGGITPVYTGGGGFSGFAGTGSGYSGASAGLSGGGAGF